MLLQTLTTALLPTLLLAAPTNPAPRQADACAPTSYTISSFSLVRTAPQHVHFGFKPTFSNPSIISDDASAGATCDAAANADGSFPNSSVCSTGGANLQFDLAGPVESAKYQVIHTWKCNGRTWMSSTRVAIDTSACTETLCTADEMTVTPQNVRPICNAPTCP